MKFGGIQGKSIACTYIRIQIHIPNRIVFFVLIEKNVNLPHSIYLSENA